MIQYKCQRSKCCLGLPATAEVAEGGGKKRRKGADGAADGNLHVSASRLAAYMSGSKKLDIKRDRAKAAEKAEKSERKKRKRVAR